LDRSCEKWRILKRQRGGEFTTYTREKADWIGHVLRRNCLLKHVIEGKIEGREDEEEDVSSYLTLRKKWNTGNCKMKHCVALCGEETVALW